jgi:site-specific recombinase XerD
MNDEILKIVSEKLKYFNFSKNTNKIYFHYIKEFLVETNKYYYHLTSKNFQDYINNYDFSSISQQNQIISSIKFFYEKVLNKKYNKIDFSRPRNEKRLPQIIDKKYLLNQISKIDNLKHKTIISLAYSVGLRVSEIINLKIEDVDSKRMIINIVQAKGKKDRIVPLSNNILNLLRNYYKEYKPKKYLFNGQFSLQYSSTSCNQIVKKYLGNKYHFHLLRHSCFTSLLENGTDLRIIQKLAGHKSVKTTEIYTHVSKQTLNKIHLPI